MLFPGVHIVTSESHANHELKHGLSVFRSSCRKLPVLVLIASCLYGSGLQSLSYADSTEYFGDGTYEVPYLTIITRGSGVIEVHKRGQTIVDGAPVIDGNGIKSSTYQIKQKSESRLIVGGVTFGLQQTDNNFLYNTLCDTANNDRVVYSLGRGASISACQSRDPYPSEIGDFKDVSINVFSSAMNSASPTTYILDGSSVLKVTQNVGYGTPVTNLWLDELAFNAGLDSTWTATNPGFWDVVVKLKNAGNLVLDVTEFVSFENNDDWGLNLGTQATGAFLGFILDFTTASDFWSMMMDHQGYLPSPPTEWSSQYIEEFRPS